VEVVASLSQGRTAAAQCGFFTYKSVPVIFEPPCNFSKSPLSRMTYCTDIAHLRQQCHNSKLVTFQEKI